MIDFTLEALLKHLEEKKFDAKIQDETQQVVVILKVQERDFPLFIRPHIEASVLQLLVFIPTNLKKENAGDLARLLHLLNKELDVPGFGMDEQNKVIFFRVMMPILENQVNKTLLDAYLNSMQIVCNTFAPAVLAVNAGMAKFEDLLKKGMEQDKKDDKQEPFTRPKPNTPIRP